MFKIDTPNNVARFLRENEGVTIPLKNGNNWNVRCPICNDKHKTYTLRRGYFLYKNGKHNYYCHNDGCECNTSAHSFNRLLKTHFPSFYEMLKAEALLLKGNSRNIDYSGIVEIKRNPEKDYRPIIPITDDSPLRDVAIKYCKDRLIPESIYSTWFVCPTGKYRDRLIIPFRNKENKIKYFQGRHLFGKEPKYLNKMGDKYVYNLDFVDPTKTVFAFEGVIDSLHCENAIAVLGLGDTEILEGLRNRFPRLCFVLDNDSAGKNTSKKLLTEGYRVFKWKDFISKIELPHRQKWDFNEVVKCKYGKFHKFLVDEMNTFVSQSYFDIHKL